MAKHFKYSKWNLIIFHCFAAQWILIPLKAIRYKSSNSKKKSFNPEKFLFKNYITRCLQNNNSAYQKKFQKFQSVIILLCSLYYVAVYSIFKNIIFHRHTYGLFASTTYQPFLWNGYKKEKGHNMVCFLLSSRFFLTDFYI